MVVVRMKQPLQDAPTRADGRLALSPISPSRLNASAGQIASQRSPLKTTQNLKKQLHLSAEDQVAHSILKSPATKESALRGPQGGRPARARKPTAKAAAAQETERAKGTNSFSQASSDKTSTNKSSGSSAREGDAGGVRSQQRKDKLPSVAARDNKDISSEDRQNESEEAVPASRLDSIALATQDAQQASTSASKASHYYTRSRESSIDSLAEMQADYVTTKAPDTTSAIVTDMLVADHVSGESAAASSSRLEDEERKSPAPKASILDEGMLPSQEDRHANPEPNYYRSVSDQSYQAQLEKQELKDSKLERVQSYLKETRIRDEQSRVERRPRETLSSPGLLSSSSVAKGKGRVNAQESQGHTTDEDDEFGFLAAVKKAKAAKAAKGMLNTKAVSPHPQSLGDAGGKEEDTDISQLAPTSPSPSHLSSAFSTLSDIESENLQSEKMADNRNNSSSSELDDIFTDKRTKPSATAKQTSRPSAASKEATWKVDALLQDVFPKKRQVKRRHGAVATTQGSKKGAANNKRKQANRSESEESDTNVLRNDARVGAKKGQTTIKKTRSTVTEKSKKVTNIKKSSAIATSSKKPDVDSDSDLTDLSDETEDEAPPQTNAAKARAPLDDYKLGEEYVI
ncbi:unnamed protein product [Sympodiomycopsis kandeliae]